MKNYLDATRAGTLPCPVPNGEEPTKRRETSQTSGSSAYVVVNASTGAIIKNCFVLRPEADDAAISAIRAYERATDDKSLAEQLEAWICAIIRRKYAGERKDKNQ